MTNVDGFSLEQLLEDHAVVGMLPRRDTNAVGLQSIADCGVSKDVVRSRGLFDKPCTLRREHAVKPHAA